MVGFSIRDARPADVAAMWAIYAPVVTETSASFEFEPPSLEEFAARVREVQERHLWLVSTDEAGEILGYAYGGRHRARPAYQWSVDTSIYLHSDAQGQGIGRPLYGELLTRLAAMGYCNAYAGITLPNPRSVSFHQAMGFEAIGVFRAIGFKFDTWHDVSWWQKPLRAAAERDDPPPSLEEK